MRCTVDGLTPSRCGRDRVALAGLKVRNLFIEVTTQSIFRIWLEGALAKLGDQFLDFAGAEVPARRLSARTSGARGRRLSLSRTRITCTACHLPPAAVGMSRRFSSSVALRADSPDSSANTGRSASTRSARVRRVCRAQAGGAQRRVAQETPLVGSSRPISHP
jgi:hypothetical protein